MLEHGDALSKRLGIARALYRNGLTNKVSIEDKNVEIKMLSSYSRLLGWNYLFKEHLSYYDIGNWLIFTTGGYSFSLIWFKNSIFLFDSHSRDING